MNAIMMIIEKILFVGIQYRMQRQMGLVFNLSCSCYSLVLQLGCFFARRTAETNPTPRTIQKIIKQSQQILTFDQFTNCQIDGSWFKINHNMIQYFEYYNNLQFQSQRPMLKRHTYLKNSKFEHKNTRSQDSKVLKPKKQDSLSPIFKEININKQNIHPNKLESRADKQYEKGRQIYYNCKQQILNSKFQKIKQPFLSTNQYSQAKPSSPYIMPLKQIEVKINNRSLQKCQIHPTSTISPKATYLVDHNNKGEFLSCQRCSRVFDKKVQIQRMSGSIIGNGLTIGEYYRTLNQKIGTLQTMKQNIELYEKQYRQMCSKQYQKHRDHYNQILQIIQNSMKESETILSTYVNRGSNQLMNKKQEINIQLHLTKQQLKTLIQFQSKQFKGSRYTIQNQVKFNFDNANKKIQTELKLPIIYLFTQIPNIYKAFENNFRQSYKIQILTQNQLEAEEKKQNEIKNNQMKNTERMTSHQSSFQSWKSNKRIQESDMDFLYCDQDFADSRTNKTHDFSFQQSNDGDTLINKHKNDCIIELVEEEDVISPVFKAI